MFRAPVNLAAAWNLDIARRNSAAIATEARATGVGMILALVLDPAREARWGREGKAGIGSPLNLCLQFIFLTRMPFRTLGSRHNTRRL